MTSRQAIPPLTPFVANREHSHPSLSLSLSLSLSPNPPSLPPNQPGSRGCQTCTLTAIPKSLALWYGSQSECLAPCSQARWVDYAEGSVTKCRHYRWVCALTATLWSLAHWYGSQSACLVPCRPRFKSMWGDHALPSLQTGHILSHWILPEFWNVHNVEGARYWAVIF